jgi:hypothetical protein
MDQSISINQLAINQSVINQSYDPQKYTLDKTGAIRFDYLFSYWIVLWFIIYYFISPPNSKIVQFIKTNMNPTIGLWFALLENIITFIFIIRSHFEWWFFFVFIFMMFSIKIFPIYLLRDSKIRVIPNVISLCTLFFMYNIYLLANGTNIYAIYDKTIQSFKEGNDQTPLFQLMHQLFYAFR